MSRYINADGLLEALNGFNDERHGNKHFINGIKTAIELVENYAVDGEVKEVRRGIWLTIKCRDPIDGHSYEVYKCSVCGAIEDRQYKCFTCGAKMDGGKE